MNQTYLNRNLSSFFLSLIICTPVFAFEESEGNYNVPVIETELSGSSNYEEDYKFKRRDGEIVRMKYTLPKELTGNNNRVDISYTGDADAPWKGENAEGTCETINGKFTCNLKYDKEKLNFDTAKTEEAIRLRFAGNENEIQRRLQVAEIFRSEPAGITSFSVE